MGREENEGGEREGKGDIPAKPHFDFDVQLGEVFIFWDLQIQLSDLYHIRRDVY